MRDQKFRACSASLHSYPGDKRTVAPYFAQLMAPLLLGRTYREPFCGFAHVFLRLVQFDMLDSAHLNDSDPGVAAIWRCVHHPKLSEELAEAVTWSAVPERDEYFALLDWVRERRQDWTGRLVETALARFRTLRTGYAGKTSGYSHMKAEQRYCGQSTGRHIRHIHRLIRDVDATITCADFETLDWGDTWADYLDPPYDLPLNRTSSRHYLDKFYPEQHDRLAAILRGRPPCWVMSMNASDEVKDRFPGYRFIEYETIACTPNNGYQGMPYRELCIIPPA